MFLAIGIGLGLVSFQFAAWRAGQQLAPVLFVAGVVLVVVLIPGVGREVNGAQRWAVARPGEPAAVRADEDLRRGSTPPTTPCAAKLDVTGQLHEGVADDVG